MCKKIEFEIAKGKNNVEQYLEKWGIMLFFWEKKCPVWMCVWMGMNYLKIYVKWKNKKDIKKKLNGHDRFTSQIQPRLYEGMFD